MHIPKPIRWILYGVGGLIGLLVLILVFLAVVQIPVDLSSHKGIVEYAAARAIGRPVSIDGKIVLSTSLRPYFALEGLRVGNPDGFNSENFAQMEATRVQVRVLPLLRWKIHIEQISINGLSLFLEENDKGAVNWTFGKASASAPETPEEREPLPGIGDLQLASDSLVLSDLTFENISVSYQAPGMAEANTFEIEKCTGAMRAGEPFTLSMNGMLLKHPYTAEVEIGSLKGFLENSRSHVNIVSKIADTHFEFSGAIDLAREPKTLELKSAANGERLDSLNGLLGLDLPPLKSYETRTLLSLRKRRMELSELLIEVGESQLTGRMTVDLSGTQTAAIIELNSPVIQLNDFDMEDWSPEKGYTGEPGGKAMTSGGKDVKAGKQAADSAVNKLLSPAVLNRYDVTLNVKAKKVMSGKDELGRGRLTAVLKDGRFSVDPLKLNLPGGALSLAASLVPDPKKPEAAVRAQLKNFDFGVIVRRMNPEAKMGGTVNLDVDLKSTADSFDGLMANSNGHFDFSGRLENLRAGAIDLWAVNVIAAVAEQEGGEASKINCVLGRWTMVEGVLSPEVFVIDTSKIRICGKGQVDFKKQRIDLDIAPTAKVPAFFGLATPIEVHGSFAEFKLGIQSGGLVGTVIKMVTSPVITPLRRLAGDTLPADGADVCDMAIGPQSRTEKPPQGCR